MVEQNLEVVLLEPSKHIRLQSTDSTNKYIQDSSISVGSWVTTAAQTSGRGRKENIWTSIGSHKIIFSGKVSLPLVQNIQVLSLLVGCAIYQTIHTLAPHLIKDVSIKWPNDLYKGQKKFGGILLESAIHNNQIIVFIGIGLNLYGKEIPLEIQDKACYLLEEEADSNFMDAFYFSMINEINSACMCVLSEDCISYKIGWAYNHSYLKNKIVQFEHHNNFHRGKVIGYSNTGCLKVQLENHTIIELIDTTPNFEVLLYGIQETDFIN
jgi:BirA family transcriptional regulator, biotin operon repressor / biotin---[acetyl-CoA-carboxylase] ligase